jgi:hypothetical protein
MDKQEVMDLYRAEHDMLAGDPEALARYWHANYEYPLDERGFPRGYWVHKQDKDHHMMIENLPVFDQPGLVFMVDRGDGEPACHCYRCSALIDSPRAGLYRPICEDCRAAIDRET